MLDEKSTQPPKLSEELKLILTSEWESISFRRARLQQTFAWSSWIFVGMSTALMLSTHDQNSLITLPIGKRIAVSLALVLCIWSSYWQSKQNDFLRESQKWLQN